MGAGTQYETLIQELFQNLLTQTEAKNIDVQHNVRLSGKSTTHQVDVYWEFETAGVRHAVVIQGKDWKSRVSKRDILAFKGVLDDLPGQPRGVFVTRTGYQSGATRLARANGILLFSLGRVELPEGPIRLPAITTLGYVIVQCHRTSFSLAGAERTGYTYMSEATGHDLEIKNQRLEIDGDWLRENFDCSINEIESNIQAEFARLMIRPCDVEFCDVEGREVNTLQQIYKTALLELKGKETASQEFCHVFDAPIYVQLPGTTLPSLKILSISAALRVRTIWRVERWPWRLPNTAQFVLRDIDDGSMRIFGKRFSAAAANAD